MCEHELKQALLDIEFLQECNNSVNLALSITRKELAAANATIEQQAQEIERLQIREHRMIEYMRDVKNFAFTINEVANNAIEEAEVQG